MTTSISSSAMLVDVSISTWTARKLDKKVTSEVNTNKKARGQAARVNKHLLDGVKELSDIAKYANTVRNWMYANTLPWSDSGSRLVTTAAFFDFKKQLEAHRQHFQHLVETFLNAYPHLISAQAFQLGEMFDRSEYPPVEEIARRFSFRATFMPIAESGDFRVDIGAEAAKELREEYEREYQLRMEEAMQEVKDRLLKSLTHLSDRFEDVTDEEGNVKAKRFHSTILDNFAVTLSQIKALNLTKDEALNSLVVKAEKAVDGLTPEALRESDAVRRSAKEKVDSLLDMMTF